MKALIPAAGLGTRFLPATKAQPKEMLLVVDRPVIQYVVEEGLASKADEVVIVNSRSKKAIEDHFTPDPDLVATLRTNHIRRVRDGQCTVYAGLTFLDILVNVERIADQCSNIGVFTLSMTDEHIMNNHHDYIHALHQGKDPLFNRAYQEAHDKYFDELKRIEHSK